MIRFKIIMLAIIILLAGCSSIPISTMYKMRNFNPGTVEPQLLVIAVRAPKALMFRKGDVVVDYSYKSPDVNFERHYLVEISTSYAIPVELKEDTLSGEYITVLHLSKEDALDMATKQQLVKEYRAKGDNEGVGYFSFSLKSSCRVKDVPLNDFLVNVYLKFEKVKFHPFFVDLDVRELKGMDIIINSIPVCD
ncbi:MAG: hypothetical protein HRU25_15295 [Psychrobium sp.]|nr:hypothetical protein [Psychrobium sp.]